MKNIYYCSLSLFLALFLANTTGIAQNVVISTQNPDGLYVCGVDQMTVTVQNGNGSPAATNLKVTVTFPPGITYVPGSVMGATQSNIGNLGAPIFGLADLAGGATATFTLSITAGCSVVAAINSGQTFANTIVANYAGGTKQLVSSFYPVETGLLNINTVTPPTATAQKGDVIMRMITMRNTRQGPIQSLLFVDQHYPGITIELVGGINQTNTPVQFNGEIPGSFFAAFGDGDNLLEESDGEITVVEKVTIEDCGIPTFTDDSRIIVGWGCGGPACRSDSAYASVTILPTTQNPNLSFTPIYGAPVSQCGELPSYQEILIINSGQLSAEDVLIAPYTLDTSFHAIDQNSFEWNNGSGWQPLASQLHTPTTLASCANDDYALDVRVSIPEVPAGDTVRLRFQTYYCEPICGSLLPAMRFVYIYKKACPPTAQVSGIVNFYPDTTILTIKTEVDYNLENCLQDGDTYPLTYWVKSGRLKQDTGFLQVIFDIPFGFDWVTTCPLNLDGQTPLESMITPNPDGSSTVRMVFDLPFTQDSVADEICLRYHCEQNLPCEMTVPNVPPRGLDYTVYPPPSDCGGCQLQLHTYTLFSTTKDEAINCAITYCDEFILVVNDDCDTTGGGGGGWELANIALMEFKAYRTNYGLQDNNDDRAADNNNTANAIGVRRDRYLVGDTMRNELKAFVLQGHLSELHFRLFFESLASDFDSLDGDEYALDLGKELFVNYDTTSFISSRLIIKTAGGQQFNCEVPLPQIKSDQHIIQVEEPNIRPPQVIDRLSNMFHQFDLDFDALCLPSGFQIGAGDSLIFIADFKFEYNFTPDGSNAPPLINFRSALCDTDKTYAWNLENFCMPKKIGQFSGYLESVNPGTQVINPCAQSTELSPFQYNMHIARANMFPFEVRPLSRPTAYSYSLPTAVDLLDTKLNYLRLQDNVPLFGVTPLTPGFGGDSLTLNLNPFFVNKLDEGYSFEISTRFDTTCGYNGTKFGRTVLGMQYANLCFHNPVQQTYYIANPNGYLSGSPVFQFFPEDDVLYLPTDAVKLDFFLRNNSPVNASNAWMTIESDGDLADVQLLMMPNQTPVPQVGGVYQFGNLTSFAQPALRFVARNLSCRAVTVTFRFGWDCTPVYNANSVSCGSFSATIELRPQPPELELIIKSQPATIPMCEPSDYFEFEVLNALDGSAYNIVPSIKLPPGMRVAPGSSQLSFPAGGAYVNMPDPVMLPGNVWQFDPEAASAILAQNGLITSDQPPLNKLRVRFKVIAECGVVSNSQPIYGAESVQSCGISSNVLRKPGMPIGIDGVEPSYTASPNLNFTNPPAVAGCGQKVQLSASIAVNDAPMAGDSIYILLPAGTSYVAGSYTAGPNAPAGTPQVFGQTLQLPLPVGLAAGSVLNFTFEIRYDDPAGCVDKFVILQTREKTQAFCVSSNQFCSIYVATGEALLNLNAQNPEIQLNNFGLNTQGGQTTFSAILENAGTASAIDPLVQLYHDQNGNGQIDPTDPLIATVDANGILAPGGVLAISGNIGNLPSSAFCDLIARIPAAENCACADHIFPLAGNQIITKGIGLCDLQAVPVGTPEVSGNTYTWLTPAGLSCTNCANATYTPGPEVQQGEMVTLVLQEKSGDCTIERKFEIQFGGEFGLETSDLTICEGESAILVATGGGSLYQWNGTGITQPNQQTQLVQPAQTAQYTVAVTFPGNCMGLDTLTVFVIPASAKTLPTLTTCEGNPVPVLDQTTDVPGIYTLTLINAKGCDSIVTQELKVVPTMLEQTVSFCEGKSKLVFDSLFTQSGSICKTEQSPTTGCNVTTCVTVKELPNPEVPEQDSALVVALGSGAVIETPNNFATYEWIPFDPSVLSCSDCPDPVVTPDTSTLFLLIVTDGNGCRDTASYRVFVCDEQQIRIPSAFSPNGDSSNDLFRVVPHEGADVILSLRVYDRWGQKLYTGSGATAQWDGRIGGKLAPSDVYVWVLEYICGGQAQRKSGDVTLLR